MPTQHYCFKHTIVHVQVFNNDVSDMRIMKPHVNNEMRRKRAHLVHVQAETVEKCQSQITLAL